MAGIWNLQKKKIWRSCWIFWGAKTSSSASSSGSRRRRTRRKGRVAIRGGRLGR
jgi:hypothetical protein